MIISHTHTKDIDERLQQLQTDFGIVTSPKVDDKLKLLALDEMIYLAREIVESVQRIQNDNK